VMVSVFVLAVGLLGIAGAQLTALRVKGDSASRAVAENLVADMADRMRANSPQAELGLTSPYNNPSGAAVANPNCLGVDNTGAATSATCSPTQLAENDFYEWNSLIAGAAATAYAPAVPASLTNGVGIVCIDSTPFDANATPTNPMCDNLIPVATTPVYAIKIFWSERDQPNSVTTPYQYVASFEP